MFEIIVSSPDGEIFKIQREIQEKGIFEIKNNKDIGMVEIEYSK